MIISICGMAGSGKSSLAKALAEKLNYQYYDMGQIFREIARKGEMSLEENLDNLKKDSTTDKDVDDYQTRLGKEEDNFVISGRTCWHFIPHSFKIYLIVNEEEGARRILKDFEDGVGRNDGKGLDTLEAVIKSQRQRKTEDDKRYKEFYNLDVNDLNHYDLVIDTTDISKKDTIKKVLAIIKDKK